jgi:integrase
MTRKRGNAEGSIRKRADGRWEARSVVADGTRKSLYADTRQEVVRLLAAAIRDRENGILPGGERQTVEQYLALWLEVCKHTIKPRTWRRYGELVRLHIVPVLGKIPLTKLTAPQVQALYACKHEEGLASSTVRQIHAVIHRALKNAVRLGLVARNVAEMVEAPRLLPQEMAVLTQEEVRILLSAASGDRLEALYVLALATGMRLGELLALKWSDVNLETQTLQVRSTLQRTRQGYVIAQPKTKSSRRRIALPATAVAALRKHRVRHLEEQVQFGGAWSGHDLVFCDPIGQPLNGINVLRTQFHGLLRRAGLPRVRFHDLRHTAATLLLERGVNVKMVSEMLGHSSIAITLSLYGHVTPHMQQQAADTMDQLLGG